MDLYAENILEHYRNPRGKGTGNSKQGTVTHSEANVSCGDELTVSLLIESNVIRRITWDGIGCAISQAAMSMLSEELENVTLSSVEGLSKDNIYDLLGIPVSTRRMKCALLCLHAVKNALRKATGFAPQSWLETVEIEGEN